MIESTAKIDLIGPRTPPDATRAVPTPPPTAMTLDQMRRNYAAILDAQAIFYPVAYTFLRKLGQGRQGTVYLGLRQGARGCITEHAIKVYDPGLYHNPEEYWTDMGRIASQVSRLQRVQSPNIVNRHAYEETHGIGYVQMEAVDGIDLQNFLSRDHLDAAMRVCSAAEMSTFMRLLFHLDGDALSLRPGLVVYILRGILRGLERLHAMNFLHGDVKPANIMIDRLGYVKLIDFGRAVRAGEELSFLLGSPLYMSPEIHRRRPGVPQSDLFSVGLVALDMLRGRPITRKPDVSEEELQEIKLRLADDLPALLSQDVLENGDLVSLLGKLLGAKPEQRYPNAKEADAGGEGLTRIDQRRAQEGLGEEYERALADYLAKLVDLRTNRVEVPGK